MSVRSSSDFSEIEDCAELEYDMWDGQFDFVGPEGRGRPALASDVSDGLEDLFSGGPLTPYLKGGTNGGKKTVAHQWCDNLTGQVITYNVYNND